MFDFEFRLRLEGMVSVVLLAMCVCIFADLYVLGSPCVLRCMLRRSVVVARFRSPSHLVCGLQPRATTIPCCEICKADCAMQSPTPAPPQSFLDFPELDHLRNMLGLGRFPFPFSPSPRAPLKGQGFSSGRCKRYLLTLPASLSLSPSQKRVRLFSFGTIQSGTNFRKKPLTPFDAASIAAYSRRRVESEVQYCTVAGGGGGESVSVSGSLEGKVGN